MKHTSEINTFTANLEKKLKKEIKQTELREFDIKLQFEERKIILAKSQIKIEIDIGCNIEEICEELNAIRDMKDYLIKGDGFINALVVSGEIQISMPFEEKKIKFDGDLKGEISNKVTDYKALVLQNILKIIDYKKISQMESRIYSLQEIIDSKYFIIDVRNYSKKYQKEEDVIMSVICNLMHNYNYKFKMPNMEDSINEVKWSNEKEFQTIISSNTEIMKYFIHAENIQSSQYKFLEYYHVLEYFFLDSTIAKVKEIVADFNHKRLIHGEVERNAYYKLGEFLNKYYNVGDNFKEENQIVEVLKNNIGYNKIVESLNRKAETGFEMLKLNIEVYEAQPVDIMNDYKEIFDKKTKKLKQCNDKEQIDKFLEKLAKRIYKIRNAIVHTKLDEKKTLFLPEKQNYELIRNDLILIRELAICLVFSNNKSK